MKNALKSHLHWFILAFYRRTKVKKYFLIGMRCICKIILKLAYTTRHDQDQKENKTTNLFVY